MKAMILVVFLISLVALGFVGFSRWYVSYCYDVECGGHLKRAADANSIDLAEQELKIVVDYLESNGLTKGNTSYIFDTPDNDIGFWYDNIQACYIELRESPDDMSALERSNLLMKLRESLLDGSAITTPEAIEVYGYRRIWGIGIGILSLLTTILGSYCTLIFR